MKLSTLAFLILASSQTFAASSFNEVRDVVFHNLPVGSDEQFELKNYEQGRLPHYEVSSSKFIVDGVNRLFNRAKSTLNDTVDYYPRLEKLVHANGACFTGTWTITESNPYSGYFKPGTKGLFIGRASATNSKTERGDRRGFGFAGKIFPTMNPEEKVNTANFFLVDVLLGTQRDRYLDVMMTNEPITGFTLDVILDGLKIAKIFKKVDSNPGYRPVYPIAELGLAKNEVAKAPKFMMLKTDSSVARNDDIDFRDEVNIKKNHADGITFNIYVNDTTSDRSSKEWKKVGNIEASESTVSYGCDRRLHFPHPKLK